MRNRLYNAIAQALAAITDDDGNPVIPHIDLWNHNVEFIEQEQSWLHLIDVFFEINGFFYELSRHFCNFAKILQ